METERIELSARERERLKVLEPVEVGAFEASRSGPATSANPVDAYIVWKNGRRIFDSERGVWSDGRGEFTCGNIVWRFWLHSYS